jgi:chemotaxis protein MotA
VDLATLVGLVGGISIILAAIMTKGSLIMFADPGSLFIVAGGTLAATLIRFPLKTVLGAFKVALVTFKNKNESPVALINQAVELAKIVRKDGLLALENQNVENTFLAKGLRLCVDGLEPDFVNKVLTQEMEQTLERHETGQKIFKAIGDSAPAMGMIGTLIGLVMMLSNMNDPKSIGPSMAVALLTTLYGALIANLVALPIADKLEIRTIEEGLNKNLVIESISAIQEGRNPRVMEELLMSYMPGKIQAQSGS